MEGFASEVAYGSAFLGPGLLAPSRPRGRRGPRSVRRARVIEGLAGPCSPLQAVQMGCRRTVLMFSGAVRRGSVK